MKKRAHIICVLALVTFLPTWVTDLVAKNLTRKTEFSRNLNLDIEKPKSYAVYKLN